MVGYFQSLQDVFGAACFRYHVLLQFPGCLAYVAIVNITIAFSRNPPPQPGFSAAIAQIAYSFATIALFQGIGNLVWMPVIVKFGRKSVYIISFTCYTATAIWAGCSKSYAGELVSRIYVGFFAGTGECVGPLTISDIFFLHGEAFRWPGVSGGIIIAGLVTITHSWRYIYYVATALIGALTLLVIFTLPETCYVRSASGRSNSISVVAVANEKDLDNAHVANGEAEHTSNEVEQQSRALNAQQAPRPTKQSFKSSLRLFNGKFTEESLWKMAYRPVILLVLPPVLWATLVMSVTIGFLVAITSNFASVFAATYNFTSWQSGFCFVSGLVGTLIGILGGGWFSDWVADFFTQRHGGIREPEMRLPAIAIAMVCYPLALVLYGCGIEYQWHWMAPTFGLGLLSFAIAQATSVSFVYIIYAYRPIAGESVVTQLAFKSAFGFLLSFHTNPWIESSGYARAIGAMAGISGAVIILWIPMFFWGRKIRLATFRWKVIQSLLIWDHDREVASN